MTLVYEMQSGKNKMNEQNSKTSIVTITKNAECQVSCDVGDEDSWSFANIYIYILEFAYRVLVALDYSP